MEKHFVQYTINTMHLSYLQKLILFTVFLVALSASLAGDDAERKNMINPYLDYEPLPADEDPAAHLSEKVSIIGTISTVIWQHMFRGPGDEPYIQECYIDPDEKYGYLPQLVGYNIGTVPFDWDLYKGKKLRFYGSFGIVTGSSKRPGKVDATFSELYFDIVDIELLRN